MDVRCLATHPFSQHPLWTRRHHQRRCHVTNTDYAAASTFSTNADLDFPLYPVFSAPLPPSPPPSFVLSFPPLSFGHSTQLRPLFRPPMLNHCPFSSVSRFPPVWDPVSFSFPSSFFFFFSISPRGGGEGDLGRVTDACEGEFRSDSGKSQSVNWK